ncbi:hypothetical protein HRbin10_02226 [bacterium HR10]|nr:hypothetical protein HRbin10_02226 [bacterium HR10]
MLPNDKRAALEKLRRTIRAAAPRAIECISHQLPAFRLDGKLLVFYGAAAKHRAFYPGSGTAVGAVESDLKGYSTSKGTIRFDADKPLEEIVRRHPEYGDRRITVRLRTQDYRVDRKVVQRPQRMWDLSLLRGSRQPRPSGIPRAIQAAGSRIDRRHWAIGYAASETM